MTAPGRSPASPAARAATGNRGRRITWVLLRLGLLLLLLPTLARGQETGGPDGAAPVEATADAVVDPSAAQDAAPVGELFVAPRSGRAYAHVFLAFGIAWVLMLGFVVALGRRFVAVERDLARFRAGDE